MPRPAADVRRLVPLAAALLLPGCLPDDVVAPLPSGDEATTARSSAALADAAGRIIYAANVSFTPEHGSTGAVAMSVRPDGSGARPLLAPGRQPWTFVGNLAFSPTRDRILFHGDGTLHVLHRDGSIVEVGHDSLNLNRASWSPDGRWIVGTQFWPATGDRKGTVWLMAADGSGTTRLSAGTTDYAVWSPDGLLAVQGDPALGEAWEYRRLDGTLARTASHRAHQAEWRMTENGSPDGSRRVHLNPYRGVYVVNVATGDSVRVHDRPGIFYGPRWSPTAPGGHRTGPSSRCSPSATPPGSSRASWSSSPPTAAAHARSRATSSAGAASTGRAGR